MDAVAGQGASCSVIAMNRPEEQHPYDSRVVATVQEDRIDDYLAAAAVINHGRFDALCVEHEFGIYGGVECDHLLRLLDAVRTPVITTLHTVLQHPSAEMRRQLCAVAARSTKLMVMNGLAIDILADVYGINRRKVAMVHHGAPALAVPTDSVILKRQLGCSSHRIISTFGLLGPGKGLEYAVQAMPAIVQQHPDAHYYILGKTHPVVKEQQGEQYREALQTLAADLGVAEHVVFVDKYFSKNELLRYLQASDIYLTPYLDMDQVTSGTLAYALACGRPIVSTPYLHARFLLEEGRGILVPPRQPLPIAEACKQLLGDPLYSAAMERINQQYGKQLLWPQVGGKFIDLCQQAQASLSQPAARRFLPVNAGKVSVLS